MMKSRPIRLELTEEQANVISKACELLARVHMGQLAYVSEILMNLDVEKHNELDKILIEATPLVTNLPRNAYHSISSKCIEDTARIAMDVRDVIRHHTSWRKYPQGGYGVNFDEPRGYSDTEPLPIISDKRDVLR